MYDICVVGHVTRDRIEAPGSPVRVQPGGTVYYSALTAVRLGLDVAAVTRLRSVDASLLLNGLQTAGVSVHAFDSRETTVYVNRIAANDVDERSQHVLSIAEPFCADHIDPDAEVYLFGPLTDGELPAECVDAAASQGRLVAMDVQGLLRQVRDRRVHHVRSEAALQMLRHVDILKAGRDEALLLTGERTIVDAARALAAAGPSEVLVTSGGAGSHILAGADLIAIPAYAPPRVVDTTGCGDTYLAAYVAHRIDGSKPEEAAHAASRVAGAKTAYHGAYRGHAEPVHVTRGAVRSAASR